MKKIFTLTFMVVLGWSLVCFAVAPNAGQYEGKVSSIVPALNGMNMKGDLMQDSGNTVLTVKYEGGKEVWTWNKNTLDQVEYDPATNNVLNQYGATATKDGKYRVNCKDKEKNDCDAGIDARAYWQIDTSPDKITYIYYGIPKDKKGDAKAVVNERVKVEFLRVE